MTSRVYDPKAIRLAVETIKSLAMDAVEQANSGHPGTPMGLADLSVVLWTRYLRYDPKDPEWLGRDRFVLSAGHASMLLYGLLHLAGFELSLDDLKKFRQWGSKTPGHPEWGHTPGVETTTGPLGQGLSNAVGLALGERMKEARFGEPFRDARIFVIASDGDVMEGISGEACSLAGHWGLSNLVVVYDDNRITIEGDTQLAFSEDVAKRYEAYGWAVHKVDGHDHEQIAKALDAAVAEKQRPTFIVARTFIAKGAPTAQGTAESHGAPLGKAEIAATKQAMGWDPNQHFHVPSEVRALFQTRSQDLAQEKLAWTARFDAWKAAHPDRAKELAAFLARTVPDDFEDTVFASLPEKDDATRSLSNGIQQAVARALPGLVGGSADLAPSTKTLIKGGGSITAGQYGGRNLHFGIREHGMGAICNGLALSGGFLPYGSTFLVFSDYMRPTLRLSALMGLGCLWVFTHDSVFLGEDGPTHQPVEHLWALRVIPNLHVARPADKWEVAAAWVWAVRRASGQGARGPTAFALSRQKVPTLERDPGFDRSVLSRGAYIVREATGGKPKVVLVATGSEVQLALSTREELEKKGIPARVVSAWCLELFAEQDATYRRHVLPEGVQRVSIEAGTTQPWRSIVGLNGLALGIDHFGASAPDKELGERFGLTPKAVLARIEAWLASP